MQFKFLPGLFGDRSSKASAAIEHATSGTVAASSGANTSVFDQTRGGWDIDKAVSEGLERVIWIFRCVDAIATNFSALVLNGRKGDPTDGEKYDLDDEIFRLLNRRPNTYETAQQFKYRLVSQVALSKRGSFIELERSNGNKLIGLHLMPPQQVEPIPDPKRFISGFRVKKAGGAGEDEIKTENIIWVRTRPHPLDPYSQLTPLTAAGIVAETDFLARLFNRNFLMNDGRPTTLVTVQGELDPDEAEEIKLRFSGGPMYAGRTTVLEADGVTVADLSANPRDVQWLEALKGSKEDIMLAFGVPESVLGNASGRTFDNADAEREGFWKDTMVPLADGIARCLDPLTGDINDDNYIAPYYDKIDVLQRQERMKHDKLLDEWQKGAISLDEYLEGTGRKPLKVPGSDAHFLGNGLVLIDPEQYELIKAIPIVGAQAPTDPAAAAQEGAQQGALQGSQEGQRNFDNILGARMQAFISGNSNRLDAPKALPPKDERVIEGELVPGKSDPRGSLRTALEGQVHVVLNTWCSDQAEILVGRLDHAKCRKFTRHWDGPGAGDKALDPGYVVQTDRWKNNLSRSLKDVLTPVIRREMTRAAKEMQGSGFVTLMVKNGLTSRRTGTPVSQVYGSAQDARDTLGTILGQLMDVAEKAAERQSERVAKRISEMDTEGKTIRQIEAEVKRMIGERSSWRRGLSTYLSTAAIEASQHATWAKAGPLVEKVWNTAGDEKVRASHRKVDGDTIGVSKPFSVGGHKMMFPGDPTAGPEETANCRCWSDYVVAAKYEGEYDDV